jgi:hypothetical protein
VVPDILVTGGGATGWDIALNEATLPRLVVNRSYYVELRNGCIDKASKSWLSEKLADAKALIKALDQRQKTILKVAAEIVKQQEGFFRQGVSQLKPLTLRAVAEAVSLHESTVSRVTSNKYLNCKRGTFELKYFFTSGVASADGEARSRPRRSRRRSARCATPRTRRHPVRRPAGRPAAREGLRPRAAHRGEIPRGDRHRQLGPAAAAEEAGAGGVTPANLRCQKDSQASDFVKGKLTFFVESMAWLIPGNTS